MGVSAKTKLETIDMTPTWEEMATTCAVLFANGDKKGRETAHDELKRMGRIADAAVAIGKQALDEIAQHLCARDCESRSNVARWDESTDERKNDFRNEAKELVKACPSLAKLVRT